VDAVLGNDIRMTWVNNNYCMEGIVHQLDGEWHVDPWGIKWVKEGPYNQIAHYPLAKASAEEVRGYRFPVEYQAELLARMEPLVTCADEYFIGCDVSPNAFEMAWRLRGMEQTMLDMAAEPELANDLLERCADFAVALAQAACARFPLDWLWTGDDVASQRALMMSPGTWREFLKPRLAALIKAVKAVRPDILIFFHSDGKIDVMIEDLIEIGVDILNPVQPECMDPEQIKLDFGNDLSFWGTVGTQTVMPLGTPAEVKEDVRRRIETVGAGGGLLIAPSQALEPDVPWENILAFFEAVEDYGRYS